MKAAVPATCTCSPLPSDRFRWSSGRLRFNLVNDRLRRREKTQSSNSGDRSQPSRDFRISKYGVAARGANTHVIRIGDAHTGKGQHNFYTSPWVRAHLKASSPPRAGFSLVSPAQIDCVLMPTAAVLFCLVVAIADGDTLTARCGEPGAYEQLKVRIAGIDAPEKAQPFGQRSKEALSDLCFREAATIKPTTRDRYGRTVAEVQCKGQDVALSQVSSGMAWVFDRYSEGHESLYPVQDTAKGGNVGLWLDPAPVAPWDWRASKRK